MKAVLCLTVLLLVTTGAQIVNGATVPAGFTDTLVANRSLDPTAMAFAPDGRIFVCQQGGALRVIKNGALLPTPFLTVTVDSRRRTWSAGHRLRSKLCFKSTCVCLLHRYHSAFTIVSVASPLMATSLSAGSEMIVMDLPNLSTATNHNGGAIHFGPDGNLYVAVGDNANGANAQTLSTGSAKLLRITSTGAIPTDNPFFNQATGNNRSIWALGLRNPFTFAFQPGTASDVHQRCRREHLGRNQRWNRRVELWLAHVRRILQSTESEFPRSDLCLREHRNECAITGGAFYNPQTVQFPANFVGNYFFSDFCGGWIQRLDPANGIAVSDFATGIANPVDLKVSPDGFLYYLARGSRISGPHRLHGGGGGNIIAPTVSITSPANGAIVARKSTVTITATASDNVGVTRVDFLVNGALQCTDTTAPYSCNWSVPDARNKTYQLQARAFDQAGTWEREHSSDIAVSFTPRRKGTDAKTQSRPRGLLCASCFCLCAFA